MANTYFDTAKIVGAATAVAVSTVGSSNVTDTEATLEGSLDDLGGNSSVDVSFEYRETGASSWNQTSPTTKSATGSYTQTVSGLSGSTDCEFRAFAKGNDSGETSAGSTLTFTTSGSIVIDDFEDNDISEYTVDTTAFTTTSGGPAPVNGTYVLEGTASTPSDQNNDFKRIISTSGLNDYPVRGDTFKAYLQSDGNGNATVDWATGSSEDNRYRVTVDPERNNLIFGKTVGSYEIEFARVNASISANTWYEVKVENGQPIVVTVTEVSSGTVIDTFSQKDTSHDTGGIAWNAGSTIQGATSVSHYDYAHITQEGDVSITGTVDDFEDNDISEYSGLTGTFSTQSSIVKTGTYALDSNGANGNIRSQSGLDYYFDIGDTIEYWCRTSSFGGLIWAVQDNQNYYFLSLNPSSNRVRFYKKIADNFNTIDTLNITLSEDTWYRFVIDWGANATFTYEVFDESGSSLGSLSVTDTEYFDGGVGWRGFGNSYFDGAKLI